MKIEITLKKLMIMLAFLFVGWSAMAATHTVTQITDDGTGATSGSLSWAINAVADGDTIVFNLSSGDVITLSAALPAIDNTLTMEGINSATGNPVTIQVASPGVSTYRVFNFLTSGKTFTLNDLIMRGGDVSGLTSPDYYGGVIYIASGTLALNRCVVKEGKAQMGGGIFTNLNTYLLLGGCTVNNNTATLTTSGGGGCFVGSLTATILNSTITGNTSSYGGGIYHRAIQSICKLYIINTTISGNSAATNGGGIFTTSATSTRATQCFFLNAIVINNTATSNPDIFKSSNSTIFPYYLWSSYVATNITNTTYTTGDLGVLADNGGPTSTMALSASAPAYQTGTYAYYNATDGYYYKGTDNLYHKVGVSSAFTPTNPEADKILTDQRGATRSATPSMGAYDGTLAPPAQPMQLVFTTTAADQSITLPLYGTVDCTVDWGDGSATEDFTTTGDKPHTFATAGTYTVSISGSLTQFGKSNAEWTGVGYLTEVTDFGAIGLTSLESAFRNADNLTSVPATLPNTITILKETFRAINQVSVTNLNLWDISAVTSIYGIFRVANNFNQDISGWNTSAVTNMRYVFNQARKFNQDISGWNVSSATDMYGMFYDADVFNQNIGGWTVNSVTNMSSMFNGADKFNQNIGSWNVSHVTIAENMFQGATSFNQDISGWTLGVTTYWAMFAEAISFNQDLSSWNTSNVTSMAYMFQNAISFNQDISSWNISKVTDMTDMFKGDTLSTANYDAILIGWAAQTVKPNVVFSAGNSQYSAGAAASARGTLTGGTNLWTITDGGQYIAPIPMQLVFTTTAADQSIALPLYGTVDCTVNWGDGSATEDFTSTSDKPHTFAAAGTYTVSISGSLTQFGRSNAEWTGVGYLTEVTDFGAIGLTSLSGAFRNADNLSSVPATLPSTVTDLSRCFFRNDKATITNLDLWDVSNVTDMQYLFCYATLFNQNIGSWNVGNVTNMEGVFYGAPVFNQNIGNWNVSHVTNMESMFNTATDFNQNISSWNVSSVTNMIDMFDEASAFNQDISGWNVSNVTDMNTMFYGATSFNQNIGNWNVNNVTDMSWMFYEAEAFDQNLENWNISSVTAMEDMFTFGNLSTTNYDALLIGWAAQTVQSNVKFGAGDSKYTAGAATARGVLTGAPNTWTISDGGLDNTTLLANTTSTSNFVYPNPVVDGFYITLGNDFTASLTNMTITDLTGKVYLQKRLSNESYIPVNDLPAGMYLVLIQTDQKSEWIKLVKE